MKPKFSPGAKVFAKVRGYPPWPARIEGCADETPKKEKYHVYFYGTGETAVVKIQDVFDFVENRNKMGKLKKLKNFTEAMQQVESELSPEQKAALKALDSEQSASPSVKDTEKSFKEVDTPKEKEVKDESTPAPSRRTSTTTKSAKSTPAASVKPPSKDNKRKLELDSSPDDSAPTPKKSNISATPTSTTSEKKDEKPQTKTAEPQSRSGRKIKPKKFNDFEEDTKEELKDESSAKEDEKKTKDAPKRPTPRPKSLKGADDNADSGTGDWYLLARGPTSNQEPIKIPIKLNRPNFEDKKLRSMTQSQWEDMVFEEARSLKKRIANGENFSEAAANDYMERFTKVKAATVHILRSPEEEEQFRKQTHDVETALLEVEYSIRNALTLRGADTKTCLQQLDKLKGLRVTALMLKKHSQIVHTIRKLRRYVGNTIVWNISDDEMNEFNADAEKIRTRAEEIVNNFKTLFFQPQSVSFWDHFSNELAAFNAKTKHMSMEDIFSIITEPE
ncbi:hypothetical protein GE061_017113 [Apolygus lucorum]|uniref:Uncharacterized protein n=1 Tax=Apolygus lucorum TaxID=248454 RepID=A0A6A4K815_APOLU|nr:hypothetical protein GE061_017113 [Apolygus lucorum]